MHALLAWLRFSLVLVPAILTALAADIPSYAVYVAGTLTGLLIIRIGALKPSLIPYLLPIELLGFGLFAHLYGGMLYFAIFSGMLAGTIYVKDRRGQVLIGALSFVVLLAAIGNQDGGIQAAAILFWFTAASLLIAYAHMSRRQEHAVGVIEALAGKREMLEASRRQTIDYARQVERHAQAEERSRIARELHDDLGHRMIRLKMMSEAALQLFEHDPQKAKSLSQQIRDQLEDSMENMRRTVRKLKPPESDAARQYALDRLIEEAARDLLIEVTFTVTGRAEPLYPSLEYVLYRNAQEAITNAVRHGGADAVSIELAYLGREIRMTIANDGALPQDRLRHGMGLRGMEERIGLLGGTLAIEQSDRFRLITVIPIRDAPAAAEGG